MISQMGKNALADKVGRVVRTLTHTMRYEAVATMLNSGRGDELVAAYNRLYETLKSSEFEQVEDIVRATYFEDTIHDALQSGDTG